MYPFILQVVSDKGILAINLNEIKTYYYYAHIFFYDENTVHISNPKCDLIFSATGLAVLIQLKLVPTGRGYETSSMNRRRDK